MPCIPSRRDALSLHHSLVVGAILLHMSYHSRMHNVMRAAEEKTMRCKAHLKNGEDLNVLGLALGGKER